MAAGVQPDGGTMEPVCDDLAHRKLGSGISGPWPMMSVVNQDGLTWELRFITRVVEFGSEVLTTLSGKWPGT